MIIFTILFIGCGEVQQRVVDYSNKISRDVNLSYFIQKYKPSFSYKEQKEFLKLFKHYYFAPWRIKKISHSLTDASWQINSLRNRFFTGENKLPISNREKEKLIYNSNFGEFGTINKRAITIVNTSLRLFPTHNPLYKEDDQFPFDFNQNSALKINKPLFVSHFSKDRGWAYVESDVALGWIPVRDLAFVDDDFIDRYIKSDLAIIIKEMKAIYDINQNFIDYVKVATIFPIAKELEDSFILYYPDKRKNQTASILTIKIEKSIIKRYPLKMNKKNITIIANELLGEKYGWGGLFLKRDCSSMTRDFFISFGIWLPRNSYSQAHYLIYIPIKKSNIEEKEREILRIAKPFESLIYLKGHIMLYIGEYKGQVYVMHNTWGVKYRSKYGYDDKKIYGKSLISNLYLGVEDKRVYRDALLINRILGIGLVSKEKIFNKLDRIKKKIKDINGKKLSIHK